MKAGEGVMSGAALLIVLCCVAGPAVLGAAAGSFIGGWLGIACAVLVAVAVAVVIHRRRRC